MQITDMITTSEANSVINAINESDDSTSGSLGGMKMLKAIANAAPTLKLEPADILEALSDGTTDLGFKYLLKLQSILVRYLTCEGSLLLQLVGIYEVVNLIRSYGSKIWTWFTSAVSLINPARYLKSIFVAKDSTSPDQSLSIISAVLTMSLPGPLSMIINSWGTARSSLGLTTATASGAINVPSVPAASQVAIASAPTAPTSTDPTLSSLFSGVNAALGISTPATTVSSSTTTSTTDPSLLSQIGNALFGDVARDGRVSLSPAQLSGLVFNEAVRAGADPRVLANNVKSAYMRSDENVRTSMDELVRTSMDVARDEATTSPGDMGV